MAGISEQIQQLIDVVREHGIEPNRVRMGHDAYRMLRDEIAVAEGRQMSQSGGDILADVGQIHGLKIVLPIDCPRDYIVVDNSDDKPKIEQITPTVTRILLTPERKEAIEQAVEILEAWMEKYSTDVFENTVVILRDMLDGT